MDEPTTATARIEQLEKRMAEIERHMVTLNDLAGCSGCSKFRIGNEKRASNPRCPNHMRRYGSTFMRKGRT
jgi:hypothetical protein